MPYVNSMKRRTDHPHSSVRNKRCMENRKSTIADDALRAHCDHHDDADGAPGIVAAVIAAGSVIVNRTWSSLGFLISPQASHVNGQEAVPPERPSSINVDTPYLATQTPLPPSPSEASPPFQRIGSANGTRVFTPLARHDSSFNSASMSYSGQTSPTISRSPRRASLGAQTNGVSKHQPRRPHIRHKQTLAQAKEQRRLELIQLRMKNGQSAAEADEYVRYMEMLGRVYARDAFATSRTFLSPSLKTTSSQRSTTTSKKSKEEFEVEYGQLMLEGAIKRARDALNSARTPRADFSVFLEDLQSIYKPAKPPLPTSLSPEDKAEVDAVLQKQGVVGKVAREQVAHNDLARLKPAQWLNDEIINFYGALIMARSEEAKKGKCKALDAHYFNSFFFDKLESPGYEKARIGKWTKKIDIFKKDVVILPVNLGNMHWTCAAINFAKKRIEYYDSMGHENGKVYRRLREYLNMEHRDKKKTDFDFTGWEDYFDKSAPQQDNGFDCGVFSCQFMEAISRGADFAFTQANMGYLRQRMILEITRGKLWNQE